MLKTKLQNDELFGSYRVQSCPWALEFQGQRDWCLPLYLTMRKGHKSSLWHTYYLYRICMYIYIKYMDI